MEPPWIGLVPERPTDTRSDWSLENLEAKLMLCALRHVAVSAVWHGSPSSS